MFHLGVKNVSPEKVSTKTLSIKFYLKPIKHKEHIAIIRTSRKCLNLKLNTLMTEQKAKLEQQLWNIANTLRGKMDADDFRDYILGFIFYKYLSRKMELYGNKALEPDGIAFSEVEG